MPDTRASSALTAKTRQSTETSSGIGSAPLTKSRSVPHVARSNPTTLASRASITDSVTSCRTTRPREAPIDRRVAISRCLPNARASTRLLTFAQQISNTRNVTVSASVAIGRIFVIPPAGTPAEAS